MGMTDIVKSLPSGALLVHRRCLRPLQSLRPRKLPHPCPRPRPHPSPLLLRHHLALPHRLALNGMLANGSVIYNRWLGRPSRARQFAPMGESAFAKIVHNGASRKWQALASGSSLSHTPTATAASALISRASIL